MLNLKSNVYKNEWLELVFADRNKLYGAYQLRRSYSSNMVKAMLLSVSLFVAVIAGPFLYNRFFHVLKGPDIVSPILDKPDEIVVYMMPKEQPKKAEAAPQQIAPAKPVRTIANLTLTPVPAHEVTVEPPTQRELATAIISSANVAGVDAAAGENALPAITGTGNGLGTDSGAGIESNQPFISVQNMPEFPGGIEAFSKYLSKNLRYPSQAQDNNVHGRVTVTFVVETNGSLSNIQILRGIGFGCDEEAMRVLRKAPAWRPGEQNGRKVRVQYTVPIVFNLGEG